MYSAWDWLRTVSLAPKALRWSLATFSSRTLGSLQTSNLYFSVFLFSHSSIWARTWLVKEADMTKEGCPVAQPRLSSLPSARMITEWPSWKVNLSTWGLMLVLTMPGQFLRPSQSISLSKWPMLPTMALFFILAMCSAMMMFLLPVALTKISMQPTESSRVTTSYPSMQACRAQIGSTSVMQTLEPAPLKAWAQPFPTSPKPAIRTFLPATMTSVDLQIPSMTECLQPQILSNLDLVTLSLTLMQGQRSLFWDISLQSLATPVVVSSEIPFRLELSLEKVCLSSWRLSQMILWRQYSSSESPARTGDQSFSPLASLFSAARPQISRMVASPPSSTIRSGPLPSSQVRQSLVSCQYSSRVSPFQANTLAVSALAMAEAAWS